MTVPSPPSWPLLEMRARLRLIDTQLVVLLARRCELQRDIRAWKQAQQIPLHDPLREADVLAHVIDLARNLRAPGDVVRRLYEHLFEVARGQAAGVRESETHLTGIKEPDADHEQNAHRMPERSGGNS